jgi:hypothetical protein
MAERHWGTAPRLITGDTTLHTGCKLVTPTVEAFNCLSCTAPDLANYSSAGGCKAPIALTVKEWHFHQNWRSDPCPSTKSEPGNEEAMNVGRELIGHLNYLTDLARALFLLQNLATFFCSIVRKVLHRHRISSYKAIALHQFLLSINKTLFYTHNHELNTIDTDVCPDFQTNIKTFTTHTTITVLDITNITEAQTWSWTKTRR